MILYLNEFDSSKYNKQFDDSVSFGFYNGGMDEWNSINPPAELGE